MNTTSNVLEYLQAHTINPETIDKDVECAISILIDTQQIFSQAMYTNSNQLSQIPTWGIIIAMMQKVYDYADSTLLAFLSQQVSASEIIARTTVEAAINLMYILQAETEKRFLIYIADYYYREMREITQWEKAAKRLSNVAERNVHMQAAQNKRETISEIPNVFSELGNIKFPKAGVEFPSISKRFKSLGREIEYQTIFAALSTQVHNGPEDLINRFLAGAASTIIGSDEFKILVELERVGFAKMLTLRAIGYYIEAIIACLNHYNLDYAIPKAQANLTELKKIYNSEPSDQSDNNSV
jgi:hypothetical protein